MSAKGQKRTLIHFAIYSRDEAEFAALMQKADL
jgi:hypothetical protein